MRRLRTLGVLLTLVAAAAAVWPLAAQDQGQQTEQVIVIGGDGGSPPHYAVPDFIAASPEAAEVARTITQVLFDDLSFEREFDMIPRDTYATIPAARSADEIAFARWRELGVDGLFFGTAQKSGQNITVQVRLFNVRSRQQVYSKEY